MVERPTSDKSLRCATCGDGFIFTRGEQELFRLRGITSDPARCPNCLRGRILTAPSRGATTRPTR
jgi:DNA-directed RNA polymerase subunit RPC12/RpoP